ncbi:MAG: efflux RND transporter periplasmic adaptor subunit [Methyloversatilis sp.]|uniref:efflux RND transporter periplasmic adaptor subunit n=1 Tax=Methyloversatilis sp. TaxID=2569862 RepID=UPI00273353EB|nr:efflux RND transporter periplasmic adaptor subunit [Methyloversatilis sp.]MDP2867434.1 efflux RND transporter periplasmic adaptor subunit [Methyloversatilis sp.]
MKHKAWLLLVVGLVAGGAYWSRKPADEAGKARKMPPVPVTVAQATTRDLPVTLEVIGRGEAFETVTLKSRVDGQVRDVAFAEGKPVVAGELLLRLDPADFQARLKLVEANLTRDQALLDKARADVARYQALLEQQFVSQEKVAEMRANAAAAAAVVQADQAALELARQQLSYTSIRAPFAGVVGARLVHPGAGVKVNETELAVINRVRPLYASFVVPEKHLSAIHAARARGGLDVEIRLPGEQKAVATGKVVFLDNAVDAATATLRMKAEIANDSADGRLAPGQFLVISLRLGTLRDAVVVPAEAVQQGPEGAFVYVLNEDGGARMRKVEVAQVRDGLAAISKGLAGGETVVTDGHSRLTPGAKVKVKKPGGKG